MEFSVGQCAVSVTGERKAKPKPVSGGEIPHSVIDQHPETDQTGNSYLLNYST